MIHTRDHKIALLEHYGTDIYIEMAFDRQLAKTSAADFIKRLVQNLNMKRLYVGKTFRFGHQRRGDVNLLRQLGDELGFTTVPLDEFRDGQGVMSSTRLREAICAGQMTTCRDLLGRSYFVSGVVESGVQAGTEMGFPTANLKVDTELVPGRGVYATWIHAQGRWSKAITNIGVRPTLYRDDALHVETHLLDYDGDLYGQRAVLAFSHWLREERRFPSRDSLIEQIRRDVDERRTLDDSAPALPSRILT